MKDNDNFLTSQHDGTLMTVLNGKSLLGLTCSLTPGLTLGGSFHCSGPSFSYVKRRYLSAKSEGPSVSKI